MVLLISILTTFQQSIRHALAPEYYAAEIAAMAKPEGEVYPTHICTSTIPHPTLTLPSPISQAATRVTPN